MKILDEDSTIDFRFAERGIDKSEIEAIGLIVTDAVFQPKGEGNNERDVAYRDFCCLDSIYVNPLVGNYDDYWRAVYDVILPEEFPNAGVLFDKVYTHELNTLDMSPAFIGQDGFAPILYILEVRYTDGRTESDFFVMKDGLDTFEINENGGAIMNTYTGTENMYRMYNPNSGEHFYTVSEAERDHLVSVGWNYEGIAWIAPNQGEPVYRLYNPNAGDHHYTLSAGEKDHLVSVGWNYEGVAWYSGGGVPLYRAYNPIAVAGAHHYTTEKGELNNIVQAGWKDEGIAWYGVTFQ